MFVYVCVHVCVRALHAFAGHEPSASAEVARVPIAEGVCLLLANKDFWLVTIAYSFSTGFFAGWGPLYAIIIQWLGPTVALNPQVG